MGDRHVIASDAGGSAIKAALYDERGVERAAPGAALELGDSLTRGAQLTEIKPSLLLKR